MMTELVVAGTDQLHMSYHQFVIIDDDLVGPSRGSVKAATNTGLAGAEPGAVTILTGIHTGHVRVAVKVYSTSPPLDVASWEDVVEVSLRSRTGVMVVRGLEDDAPQGLPNPAHSGPGDYRVRVHATGRDVAVDLTASDPVEDYLVETWPADPHPPAVHKMTSGYGKHWQADT